MLLELQKGTVEPVFEPDLRTDSKLLATLPAATARLAGRQPWAVRAERAMNSFDARYGLHQPHIPVNGKLEGRDWAEFHWFLWVLGINDDQLLRITDWNHLGGWTFTQLVNWLEHPSLYFKSHPQGYKRHEEALAKIRTKPEALHLDNRGLIFIEGFEGFSSVWYDDGGGTPTIGFGHTGEGGVPTPPITRAQGQALFKRDIVRYENDVKGLVTVPLGQNQLNALTSFDYNLGPGNTADIVSGINHGNPRATADAMLAYDHVGGAVWPGLTRRRKAERALFLS